MAIELRGGMWTDKNYLLALDALAQHARPEEDLCKVDALPYSMLFYWKICLRGFFCDRIDFAS